MGKLLRLGADGNPVESSAQENDLDLSDNTTGNTSTSKHGFCPKLPNDSSKYLDGTGNFTTPAGGTGGGLTISDLKKFGLA